MTTQEKTYTATHRGPLVGGSKCSICSKPFDVGARYVYVDHGQGVRPVHVGCPRVVEGSAVVYIASEDGPTDDLTTQGQLSDISSPEPKEPEATPEPPEPPEPALEPSPEPSLQTITPVGPVKVTVEGKTYSLTPVDYKTTHAAIPLNLTPVGRTQLADSPLNLTGVTLNHERGGRARAQVGDWVLVKTLDNPAKIKAFVDLLYVEVESQDSGPVKVLTALCTLCDMSKRVAGLDGPHGVKHDTKKPRWTLVPWASVSAIVEVLEYGAQKYAPDNWRKVENGRERYANAALRHIMAWLGGERCDPESGLPHLAHAGCCILFLLDVDRVANKP